MAAVLASMLSTTGTSHASAGDDRTTPTASPLVLDAAAPICPAGYVCLFVDVDQKTGGYMWAAGAYHSNFTQLPCEPGWKCKTLGDFNDEASSWHNNTNRTYCVSWGINGGNPDNSMPPGTYGNFTTTGWNDEASSIGFIGCP
ncbi:peptidase inhibitor family I36 protein [Plantactinospora sp. B6F1]|uniref:peptidase inhibitor family I36 protein n=1 Tax=Plantactinospora sp. B6F1 TaxID=3158971 RepID=UPI0013EF2624